MLIIGLCGRKQVGKDSFAKFGTEMVELSGKTAANTSFAYPLKRFVVDYLGVPSELPFGSNDDKDAIMGDWGHFFNEEICSKSGKSTEDEASVRDLLQVIGTDVFRKMSLNFWVNVFKLRMGRETYDTDTSSTPDVVFVTDIRFQNEVEAVKSLGGYVVKIERQQYSDNHDSEACVDEIDETLFDEILEGPSIEGLDNLKENVFRVLQQNGVFDLEVGGTL